MDPKKIANKDRLIFALDVADTGAARKLVEQLGDSVSFYKLGLELCMSGGYFELLDWMVGQGKKIFVDAVPGVEIVKTKSGRSGK